MPSPDARFLTFHGKRSCRTGDGDSPALFEIYLMFEPDLPLLDRLYFIQKQVFRSLFRWFRFIPESKQAIQPGQFEQRMVECRIQDVAGRDAFCKQFVNSLQKQRRFADLRGPSKQKRPSCRGILHPMGDFMKRCTFPCRKIREPVP